MNELSEEEWKEYGSITRTAYSTMIGCEAAYETVNPSLRRSYYMTHARCTQKLLNALLEGYKK